VNGGAAGTIYYPRINFARVAEGASVISVTPAQGTEGDSANMLGHHGTSLKVSGQIADIDYQDGFGFSRGYATYDSVVIDLGQDRQIDTLVRFARFRPRSWSRRVSRKAARKYLADVCRLRERSCSARSWVEGAEADPRASRCGRRTRGALA
ncbi:MAG: hypothetical protein HYX75_05370, partial [Acidobacteria bacterium]|nr:hypothetical protein [Acidobacteriota bacterium]